MSNPLQYRLHVWRGAKDLHDCIYSSFVEAQRRLRILVSDGQCNNAWAAISPLYTPPPTLVIGVTRAGKMFDKATGKRLT